MGLGYDLSIGDFQGSLIYFNLQPKFNLFILRECEQGRGRERERERERIPSKLCSVSTEPDVGLNLMTMRL